jgi:hypothetical protein
VGLVVTGAGTASYRALAEEPKEAESPPAKPGPAEAKVKRLKKQLTELTQELRQAEEEVAKERAVPPPKKPVAIIFGDVPITRDELADYLLSRMTAKQLETYVNRRILEHACKKEGITVTMAEVDEYAKAGLKKTNLTEDVFRAQLLRGRNMTWRDWKEDVIRTQILLKKLTGGLTVREKDLRDAYEARYGERVECNVLILPNVEKKMAEDVARRLRLGQMTFAQEAARFQPRRDVPLVISRRSHSDKAMEKAAFALRQGEISPPIAMPPGFVILQCRRRFPANTNTRFEDVRESLKNEVQERLKRQDVANFFKKLQAEARAKLLWTPPEDKAGKEE